MAQKNAAQQNDYSHRSQIRLSSGFQHLRDGQQETSNMEWTTPLFVEIKMDAEIGSYQEEGEQPEPVRFSGNEIEPRRTDVSIP